MAKLYESKKTHMTIASGKVTAISPARDAITVETNKYDNATKTNAVVQIEFKSATPITDELAVGKNVTVCGFYSINPLDPSKEGFQAISISPGNQCFEYSSIAVLDGDVVFANFNEEKNKDGSPRMTKERTGADGAIIPPKERKPHFDIGINVPSVEEDGSTKRTLHVVSAYPYGDDMSKIERYKKLFANYDPKENPAKATIVTAPGRESSSTKEFEGRTYVNHYSNHMGINSLDVTYEKERTKTQPAGEEKKDEIPEVKVPEPVNTPAPQVNGLDAPVPTEPEMEDVFI